MLRNQKSNRREPQPDIAPVAVPQKVPVFRARRLETALERCAALYAVRMMARVRPYDQIAKGESLGLLRLSGLELQGEVRLSEVSPWSVERALAKQRERLEARGEPAIPALDRNIEKLGKALRLSGTECAVLRLAVVAKSVDGCDDLLQRWVATPMQFFALVHHALGRRVRGIATALGSGCTLRRIGVFGRFDLDRHNHPLEMRDTLAVDLLSPSFDLESIQRSLLRPAPAAALSLEDFCHQPEAAMIVNYMACALKRRSRGVNILIHGDPGTGKTEFVRALALSLGARLDEVPVEDEDRDPISGEVRFRAYTLAQRLLARNRGQLLLFDEVEDVFGSGGATLLSALVGKQGRDPESLAKGWINLTLESNSVPAIWVCNDIRAVDPAYLRRFDLVAQFRTPPRKVRERIVERYFPDALLSETGVAALSELEALPPAQIERAAKVVKALGSKRRDERDAQAKRIVEMSLRAMGHSTARKTAGLPPHYDPAFLNTDRDLSALIEGLRAGRAARLCLFGPPGTGKTALGHHLAQVLDRPLHVKRASDLVSMWVGETEKNLAQAFLEAGDEGAILLIDEADSFLQDRSRAQRSWEVSQVNEMLTQMEAFEGIFIASTNLVDSLDAASLRRFDFKLRFDYLGAAQRVALFRRVLDEDALDAASLHRIERLDRFTPGDMANALRQLRVLGQVPEIGTLLDLVEAELRLKPGGAVARIGFVR
ncbi:AAA family ATPase [Xanthomonadaceae bacterium JHOS43]|nr:AAA family ATPase [Xanthomonadaceae bacterium JHOS43]